ncbi:MAG TPA: ROK family protein [Candidatus Saccharimonadales bacterium]|nr:ROK family protein [Candidatus Saccharimonadales bacterium]
MYLGIDIGGTKTLAAVFNDQGEVTEKVRFPTDQDYSKFLGNLERNLADLSVKDFEYCGVGMPASVLDRSRGQGISFGNLPWRNVPMRNDVADLSGCPAVIENDTKLAGLSEATLLKDTYRRVLYVTVSTGVGFAFVADGAIDTNFGDAGGRSLLLEHDGRMMPWEDFASGRAIVERFGKKASEITDDTTWRQISHDLAQGLIMLIPTVQPEVIVVGGSVGTHFEKYGGLLAEELAKYELPLVPLPGLIGARRPEEAVIYGCYELIKQAESGDGSDHR